MATTSNTTRPAPVTRHTDDHLQLKSSWELSPPNRHPSQDAVLRNPTHDTLAVGPDLKLRSSAALLPQSLQQVQIQAPAEASAPPIRQAPPNPTAAAAASIPREVFTAEFQQTPDFERILHTANQSPYLVSMLAELHARGGRVDVTNGNGVFYRVSEDTIYIDRQRLPEPDEQGRIIPGAGRVFATLLAHEAGHATVQRRDLVAKTPWQAGENGLIGEGVAFRSEYIVARQLEHANPGTRVPLSSELYGEASRGQLDALARTSGIDTLIADRTKNTRDPAWSAFDQQAQRIGTEHYRYLHPSTMPGLVYNESYAEKWALGEAKSVLPTWLIDAKRLSSDHVQVIRNPDDSWRLVGKNVPSTLNDEVMNFDVRFNAKGVIQGDPQVSMKTSSEVAQETGMFATSRAREPLPLDRALMEETAASSRAPAHAPWVVLKTAALQTLQPQLQAHFNAEQIESLSAAAAVHTVRHAHLGPVNAMLLSRDRQTLAFKHEPMQLSEMSVPAALEKSAAEHLQQASRDPSSARDAPTTQFGAPAMPATHAPRAM